MSETIDAARRLIESRLVEIETEAGQLGRALHHLGDGGAPHPSRPRRSRKAAATRASGDGRRKTPRREAAKRAPRGRRREQLLAAIGASPGARPSELAATIGIRPTQASVLIAKARAEKLIVKRGEGYALKK